MASFYNEIEPYAAQWLRNLIKRGLIADGEVDTRSIVDISPDDIRGFKQCHFFAGIGGWSHALRLAGWPDDRPVWTGSCPCQPFSVAGKGAGTDDPRHLWPHFHRLISAVRPPVVLGEQVAGAAGYGWLDGVRADLEREGYASRGADLPALAVNAPHIRQRLYWVAQNMEYTNVSYGEGSGLSSGVYPQHNQLNGGSAHSHMADAANGGRQHVTVERSASLQPMVAGPREGREQFSDLRAGVLCDSHMADTDQGKRGRRQCDGDGDRDGQAGERHEDHGVAAGGGEDRLDVAHPGDDRTRREVGAIGDGGWSTLDAGAESLRQTNGQGGAGGSDARSSGHMADANVSGLRQRGGDHPPAGHGHTAAPEGRSGHWDDHVWLTGSDGKARRSQPGLPLLAYGVSGGLALVRTRKNGAEETHTYNRVGALRAFGNAIVPSLAAEVVRAFMETENATNN